MNSKFHIKSYLLAVIAIGLLYCQNGKAQTCQADFSYAFFDTVPGAVAFFNLSTADTVIVDNHWDFGDGATSNDVNPVHHYASDGVYNVCLSISSATQCYNMSCKPILLCSDCVWPGDANNDGIVNNFDLLPLGLAFDSTGVARLDQSMNFAPHLSNNWSGGSLAQFANGVNFKHSDCNGDGIVDASDTLAIKINYGKISELHPFIPPASDCSPGIPHLFFVPQQDSIKAGDTLTVDIRLGANSLPANNIYGVAFSVRYDNGIVDSTKPLRFSFQGTDLGQPSQILKIDTNFPSDGRLDIAEVRTIHTNKQVKGLVGTASFVMEDDLIGKMANTTLYSTLHLAFENVVAVNSAGDIMSICGQNDSVVVYQLLDAVKNPENQFSFKLYPNPSKDVLYVTSTKIFDADIIISDVLGHSILTSHSSHQERASIDVSKFSSGLYFLTIKTGESAPITKRFEIIK